MSSARRDAAAKGAGAYISYPWEVRESNSSLKCVLSSETSNKTVPCIVLVRVSADTAVNQKWTAVVTLYVVVVVMAVLPGFVATRERKIGRSQFL